MRREPYKVSLKRAKKISICVWSLLSCLVFAVPCLAVPGAELAEEASHTEEASRAEEAAQLVFVSLGSEAPSAEQARLAAHERARLHLQRAGIHTARLVTTKEEANAALAALAEQENVELVAVLSPELAEAAEKAAAKTPEKAFLVYTEADLPDFMSAFQARTWEAWYLVGVFAAKASEGARLGWLAPADAANALSRESIRNVNAFALGARSVRPESRVALLALTPQRLNLSPGELIRPLAAKADIIVLPPELAEARGADFVEVARSSLRQTHSLIGGCIPQQAPVKETEGGKEGAGKEGTGEAWCLASGPDWNWSKMYGSLLTQLRFGLWHHRMVWYGLREGVVLPGRFAAESPTGQPQASTGQVQAPEDLAKKFVDVERACKDLAQTKDLLAEIELL